MASPTKVFRALTARAEAAPIPFEIDLENEEGEHRVVSFEAFGVAPADALLIVGRMGRVTDKGQEAVDVHELAGFFEKVLLPESAQAWVAMVEDSEWNMQGETLIEVWTWIQEEWNERPTRRSPGSSATRSPNGTSSTASASSPGSDSTS